MRETIYGSWQACGLREGLDMRGEDGRLCYYPVGRGGLSFEADDALRLTTVNAAGTFVRRGSWRVDGDLLHIRLGRDSGAYRFDLAGDCLRLIPERTFYSCADRLLHRPVFRRCE